MTQNSLTLFDTFAYGTTFSFALMIRLRSNIKARKQYNKKHQQNDDACRYLYALSGS